MSATIEAVREERDVHASARHVGERLGRFDDIDPIPLPILVKLANAMDELRHAGLAMRPGAPRSGMCVKLPAGVGKSTSARLLVRSAAARSGMPVEKGPVLHVELNVDQTESLWNAILRALGDPFWHVGYPKAIQSRALKFLAKRGVELIIVDEFNHSVDRGQARELMNTVKLILNAGIVPVVCMGTDDELAQLPKLDAFERRMVFAPAIGPLRWEDDDHATNWRGFLQGLDQAIVDLDILSERSRLGSKKLAEDLCDACGGVIGYAQWVVHDALGEVLRRGGTSIERADLAISVGRLFVKHGIHDRVNTVEFGA